MKKHTLYYIKLLGSLIFTGDFKTTDDNFTFVEAAFVLDLLTAKGNSYSALKKAFTEQFKPVEITEENYRQYLHKNNSIREFEVIDEIEKSKLSKHRGYKFTTEYHLPKATEFSRSQLKEKYKFIV